MPYQRRPIPKWILIVSGLLAFLEIVVSFAIAFSPESILESVDLSAKGVKYLVYMWAVRQFSLGCIFAYSTIEKSVSMLTIAYIFFLVMMIGDLVVGIIQNENSMIVTAMVMIVISCGMLVSVNRSS